MQFGKDSRESPVNRIMRLANIGIKQAKYNLLSLFSQQYSPVNALDAFLAMRVFVKVVEQGHFARAAERLEISTSAASRHVSDLETRLNARLLNRTTRRLSLTEGGQVYYERCVQLLAD